MGERLVIDSQVHIWGRDTPERPWPTERHTEPHREVPLGAEALLQLMDAAGVDRAVLVPPSWEGDRNDLVGAAAVDHPDRFAAMIRLPLERPITAAKLAERCAAPGVLGVRCTFGRGRQRAWLTDGTADWLWRAADDLELALMCWTPGGVRALGEIARAHPGARFIVDHAGLELTAPPDAVAPTVEEVCRLATIANVAVKASALPAHASGGYPFTSLHAPILRLVDAFGPERVFFGSDLTRLSCSYAEVVALFAEAVPGLSATERALILGRALADYLRWPVTDAPG